MQPTQLSLLLDLDPAPAATHPIELPEPLALAAVPLLARMIAAAAASTPAALDVLSGPARVRGVDGRD